MECFSLRFSGPCCPPKQSFLPDFIIRMVHPHSNNQQVLLQLHLPEHFLPTPIAIQSILVSSPLLCSLGCWCQAPVSIHLKHLEGFTSVLSIQTGNRALSETLTSDPGLVQAIAPASCSQSSPWISACSHPILILSPSFSTDSFTCLTTTPRFQGKFIASSRKLFFFPIFYWLYFIYISSVIPLPSFPSANPLDHPVLSFLVFNTSCFVLSKNREDQLNGFWRRINFKNSSLLYKWPSWTLY